MNHLHVVTRVSEGGRPSEKPPVVSVGSASLTDDPDETHKKVTKDVQAKGFHPYTNPGSMRYVLVRVIVNNSKGIF